MLPSTATTNIHCWCVLFYVTQHSHNKHPLLMCLILCYPAQPQQTSTVDVSYFMLPPTATTNIHCLCVSFCWHIPPVLWHVTFCQPFHIFLFCHVKFCWAFERYLSFFVWQVTLCLTVNCTVVTMYQRHAVSSPLHQCAVSSPLHQSILVTAL